MSPRIRNRAASQSQNDDLDHLRAELAARTAETEWLRIHYEQHLREAMVTNEMLQARPAFTAPDPADLVARDRDLLKLKTEVERLQAAEVRYLDRIAELKDMVARDRSNRDSG